MSVRVMGKPGNPGLAGGEGATPTELILIPWSLFSLKEPEAYHEDIFGAVFPMR